MRFAFEEFVQHSPVLAIRTPSTCMYEYASLNGVIRSWPESMFVISGIRKSMGCMHVNGFF